jgi:hypothetical protein
LGVGDDYLSRVNATLGLSHGRQRGVVSVHGNEVVVGGGGKLGFPLHQLGGDGVSFGLLLGGSRLRKSAPATKATPKAAESSTEQRGGTEGKAAPGKTGQTLRVSYSGIGVRDKSFAASGSVVVLNGVEYIVTHSLGAPRFCCLFVLGSGRCNHFCGLNHKAELSRRSTDIS